MAFLKDLAANAPQDARNLLTYAWILDFLSVLLGVGTLLRLTGELEKTEHPSIYDRAIRTMSFAQIALFLLALATFGANAQPPAP